MDENLGRNPERRSNRRYRVETGVLLLKNVGQKTLAGALLDLSFTGLAAIYASDIFAIGQKISSKIEWAGGGIPVQQIQCLIRNKAVLRRRIGSQGEDKEFFRYGMRFINLHEDQHFEVQSCIHYHAIHEN